MTKPKIESSESISSIFTARRDLLHGVKLVLAGSRLTIEEADLLVSLYGVRELDWDDLEHDPEGFVPFHQLERFLVHNPSLLSRRIRKLAECAPPLLKVETAGPESGLHFNAKRVRITDSGVKRIEPVWKRYAHMSAKLLEGIPYNKLEAHHFVNAEISRRIGARRHGLGDLFTDA